MENYVMNVADKTRILPGGIHAQLSTHYFTMAKDAVISVLVNGEKSAVMGYTSGGRRSFELYRANDGDVYVIINWQGDYDDAYHFLPGMEGMYFEGYESEIPQWEPSDKVKKIINDYVEPDYGYNVEPDVPTPDVPTPDVPSLDVPTPDE